MEQTTTYEIPIPKGSYILKYTVYNRQVNFHDITVRMITVTPEEGPAYRNIGACIDNKVIHSSNQLVGPNDRSLELCGELFDYCITQARKF